MSNFSSFKNVPPAFQNFSTEKAWKVLREPFTIAILASLGFHGLLWFGLPLLPASSTKQPEQRTLNVIELSPLEQQARLPESSTLVPPLPPLTKPPATNGTPGAVPLVPINPSIADPGSFYPIPETSTRTVTPNFSITVKPPATKPTAKSPSAPAASESPETTDETPASEQPSTRSEDLTTPDGKPLIKSREDQAKLALQQSFAFNPAGTTDQDFATNSAIVASQIADRFNIRDWEKPITTRATYPKDACQFQHDGKPVKGMVGLVVVLQPDGTLADTALMVKSSGFKGLDEAARQYVEKNWTEIAKQNKIEPESKPSAFPLAITVEPAEGDCPAKPVS